ADLKYRRQIVMPAVMAAMRFGGERLPSVDADRVHGSPQRQRYVVCPRASGGPVRQSIALAGKAVGEAPPPRQLSLRGPCYSAANCAAGFVARASSAAALPCR